MLQFTNIFADNIKVYSSDSIGYNQALPQLKYYHVLVNMDNCYNCTLGIRYINKLHKDTNAVVSLYIEGLPKHKMNAFLKEYGLPAAIFKDLSGYWYQYMKSSLKQNPQQISSVVFYNNPYFFKMGSLSQIESFDLSLKPSPFKMIEDSFYYTSFGNAIYKADKLYFSTFPKNDGYVWDLKKNKLEPLAFDRLYLDKTLLEGLFKYDKFNAVKHLNDSNELLKTLETYLIEDGLDRTSLAHFFIFKDSMYAYARANYGIWTDTMALSATLNVAAQSFVVNLERKNTKVSKAVSMAYEPDTSKGKLIRYNAYFNYFRYGNLDTFESSTYTSNYFKGAPMPTSLIHTFDNDSKIYKFLKYQDTIATPINFKSTGISKMFTGAAFDDAGNKYFNNMPLYRPIGQKEIKGLANIKTLPSDTALSVFYLYCAASNEKGDKADLVVSINSQYYHLSFNPITGIIDNFKALEMPKGSFSLSIQKGVLYVLSSTTDKDKSYFQLQTAELN